MAMTSDPFGSGRRQFLGHPTLAVLIDTGTRNKGKAVALIEPDSSRVIGLHQEQRRHMAPLPVRPSAPPASGQSSAVSTLIASTLRVCCAADRTVDWFIPTATVPAAPGGVTTARHQRARP